MHVFLLLPVWKRLFYKANIHLMSDPEGNSQFCFPESPNVSHDFVLGNIRTGGKTKLTGFPRDKTLSVLLYFQAFTSTAITEYQFKPERIKTVDSVLIRTQIKFSRPLNECFTKYFPYHYLHLFPPLAAVCLPG